MVKVKALEWFGPDLDDEYYAKSVVGTYSIGSIRGDGTRWCMFTYHPSVNSAKAYVQDDYERRILSALEEE